MIAGSVPLLVSEPSVESGKKRPQGSAPAARRPSPRVAQIDLPAGNDGRGNAGAECGERRGIEAVTPTPAVGAIDPFEHRPLVGEERLGFTNMSDGRRANGCTECTFDLA